MKRFLLWVTLLLWATAAGAQVRLTASTDKTDLMLDDELTLTVKVTGVHGNMVMPQLPSLPAFNVYSQGADSITVNGKSTFVFRYTMMPRFVGNTTIGPVTFKYGGQTYQTKPIAIHIYRSGSSGPATQTANAPATAAAPTQEVANLPPLEKELATRAYAHTDETYFVVAAVTNPTPYVNEPVTLGVRFYYAAAFYDAGFHAPTVSNLFMEELADTQGQQTIRNRVYRYEEKRYRLTGVSAGEATISASSVVLRPGDSPLSVLDRFFGGAAVQPQQTVSSVPLKLTIRPLPVQNRPDSFYGAVGTDYVLSAQLTPASTQAGEAVTWSATVQGTGNLKTTQDLSFPQVPGLNAYPAAAVTDYLPNTKNRSYKVFKTELVPAASGTYTLPAVQWSYFDLKTHGYKTLSATVPPLSVSPATQTAGRPMNFAPTSSTDNTVQTLGKDIRYVTTLYAAAPTVLTQFPAWKWAHVLAFAWLAGCLFAASIGKKTVAKKHAYSAAKARLKRALTYENISDALAGYLQEKWHISTSSLPLKHITGELSKRRISSGTLQEFATLWKDLESARFAPITADTSTREQFVARTEALLKKLEGTK